MARSRRFLMMFSRRSITCQSTRPITMVLGAAVAGHAFVEGAFAGMSERRVAEIVQQGDGFGQVFVEAELAGDRAADLGDFERVRETRAVMVAGLSNEDLRLVHQSAKR